MRNVHEANAGEICQECNKVFNKKALLGAHIRNVHESADDLFCHVCGSQCKNLNALKKHVKKCEEKPKRAQKHFVHGNRVGDAEFGNDTYYDEVCDRTYLNYKSFRVHNHQAHLDDPICGTSGQEPGYESSALYEQAQHSRQGSPQKSFFALDY